MFLGKRSDVFVLPLPFYNDNIKEFQRYIKKKYLLLPSFERLSSRKGREGCWLFAAPLVLRRLRDHKTTSDCRIVSCRGEAC